MKLPILGIMFLILFTLKVAEVGAVASWSWWLVTAPLWAPLGILCLIFGVSGGMLLYKLWRK